MWFEAMSPQSTFFVFFFFFFCVTLRLLRIPFCPKVVVENGPGEVDKSSIDCCNIFCWTFSYSLLNGLDSAKVWFLVTTSLGRLFSLPFLLMNIMTDWDHWMKFNLLSLWGVIWRTVTSFTLGLLVTTVGLEVTSNVEFSFSPAMLGFDFPIFNLIWRLWYHVERVGR